MAILLAFAPFIAFAIVDRLAGATPGLVVGALVSAGLIARDYLAHARRPKILEIGTFLVFGGLALYSVLTAHAWSLWGVRLLVDAGLLSIVLISMVIGSPFTLQYAREETAPELWRHPDFVRTNYVITGAWALAFVIMVVADAVMVYMPEVPQRVGIIATVVALVGAVKFTGWYPKRQRAGPRD